MKPFVISFLVCATLGSLPASGETKVVLLPPDNISGNDAAGKAVVQLVSAALLKRGWMVVAPAEVETDLEAARVRYLDSVDSEVAASILSSHDAGGYVTTTVMTWREGENPIVALSARFVATSGVTKWGDAVAIAANDTEGMLGFGRVSTIEDLSRRAVGELFDTFPSRDGNPGVARGRRKPLFIAAPRTYRSSALPNGQPRRVCILPFETTGNDSVAPRVVQDLLTLRLLSTGDFEIVEPAAFRAAMRAERIRSFRGITPQEMKRLAERIGTPLFVKGTIYEYREVPLHGSGKPPGIQLEMTLVDVESERVVWASHHGRRGDDYAGLFLRGVSSNAVALADRLISEIVSAGQNTKPRDIPAAREER